MLKIVLLALGLAVLCAYLAKAATTRTLLLEWDASPDSRAQGYSLWQRSGTNRVLLATVAGRTNCSLVMPYTNAGPVVLFATAYGADGLESEPSNDCTIPAAPLGGPGMLRYVIEVKAQ